MKIYLLADMEGISGIGDAEAVKSRSAKFSEACQLMAQEINAAIEEAFETGVREMVVCDTHAGGGAVSVAIMDSRAAFETPNCGRLMPSLDGSFDGLILLGCHARAGTLNAFLDHTVNSSSWFEFKVNGQRMGEIGICASYAGHYDVPVIMVSGDQAAVEEATNLLGNPECAVVKRGIGRNRATCLSVSEAHSRIRGAVKKALRSMDRFEPFKPALPATVELTFCRSDFADEKAALTKVQRVDARKIRYSVRSLLEIGYI